SSASSPARIRPSTSRAPSRSAADSRLNTYSLRCAKTRSTSCRRRNSAPASAPTMELLTDPHAWIAFVTLSALEIVLGIDNIIFISILVGRLPPARRESARITGLALAMFTRIGLLFSIVWLTRLTRPWFSILGQDFSGRDIILLLGGLFLLAKSVTEIHETLECE